MRFVEDDVIAERTEKDKDSKNPAIKNVKVKFRGQDLFENRITEFKNVHDVFIAEGFLFIEVKTAEGSIRIDPIPLVDIDYWEEYSL